MSIDGKRVPMSAFMAVTTCNLHNCVEMSHDLLRTVDSLRRHSSSRLLLVDDGSPRSYQRYVQKLASQYSAECLLLENNHGIGHAKNQCLEVFLSSESDVVFLLDDDIEILSSDFEQVYADSIRSGPCEILSFHDPLYSGYIPFDYDGYAATANACGVCVAASRMCVETTGFYLELPGKWGEEHIEYADRAARRGFAPEGVYLDLWGSLNLIRIASHRSVFSQEEKAASRKANLACLDSRLRERRHVLGLTSYRGLACQQAAGFDRPLSRVLRQYRFTHVLEVGTGHGGFAVFLRDALPDAVIQSWDVEDKCVDAHLTTAHVEFIQGSVFAADGAIDDRLASFVKSSARLAVFVDGGNKLSELCAVAPLLKTGDFVLVHDYSDSDEVFERQFRGRVWEWLEITLTQIVEKAECARLVPRHPELKHLMWGCFESL